VRGAGRQEQLVRRLAQVPVAEPSSDVALREALDALPDGDRELLWLWAWEQLPPREIALVLDISANAASIRLHRASKKLRDLLLAGKDGGPPGHLGQRQGREAPR